MVKMTFTLDDATVESIRRIARRLGKPQSEVIREAIPFYEPHAGQLTRAERQRRVALFDEVIAAIPAAPAASVDRELASVRESRRTAWQRRQRRRA
jgi:hypothetical protein